MSYAIILLNRLIQFNNILSQLRQGFFPRGCVFYEAVQVFAEGGRKVRLLCEEQGCGRHGAEQHYPGLPVRHDGKGRLHRPSGDRVQRVRVRQHRPIGIGTFHLGEGAFQVQAEFFRRIVQAGESRQMRKGNLHHPFHHSVDARQAQNIRNRMGGRFALPEQPSLMVRKEIGKTFTAGTVGETLRHFVRQGDKGRRNMELHQLAFGLAERTQDRDELNEVVGGKDLHQGAAQGQEIVELLLQRLHRRRVPGQHVQPVFSGVAGGAGRNGRSGCG